MLKQMEDVCFASRVPLSAVVTLVMFLEGKRGPLHCSAFAHRGSAHGRREVAQPSNAELASSAPWPTAKMWILVGFSGFFEDFRAHPRCDYAYQSLF